MSKDYRKYIGNIIREYRLAARISQMALAEKIGISYQQLQKYEKGINNISVQRFIQICKALKMPASSLLEGQETEKIAEEVSEYGLSKEEKKLLDLFRKIDNKDVRRGLLIEMQGIVEMLKKK